MMILEGLLLLQLIYSLKCYVFYLKSNITIYKLILNIIFLVIIINGRGLVKMEVVKVRTFLTLCTNVHCFNSVLHLILYNMV